MRAVRLADLRRPFRGLMIACLGTAVGCSPGPESSGGPDAQKVEQIKKTTSEYMKSMKKRGQSEPPGGPRRSP